MTVFTVTVWALRVIVIVLVVVVMLVVMLVRSRVDVVVLLLQAEGHGGLVPGRHVEPVLLLQLPPGVVPLRLHLRQSSADKLLLEGADERGQM